MGKRMYISVFIIVFLISAFFVAWRDQYRQVKILTQSLMLPPSSLSIQDIQASIDKTTVPPSLQMSLLLLNSADIPIKYQVESIDIVIDGQKIEDPVFSNRGGIIPRRQYGKFLYPVFNLELFKLPRVHGTIHVTILYNDLESLSSRRIVNEGTFDSRLDTAGTAWTFQKASDDRVK